jgi:hypothetical protein
MAGILLSNSKSSPFCFNLLFLYISSLHSQSQYSKMIICAYEKFGSGLNNVYLKVIVFNLRWFDFFPSSFLVFTFFHISSPSLFFLEANFPDSMMELLKGESEFITIVSAESYYGSLCQF